MANDKTGQNQTLDSIWTIVPKQRQIWQKPATTKATVSITEPKNPKIDSKQGLGRSQMTKKAVC